MDFFKKALQEERKENPKTAIGTHKFLTWLASKKPILEGENKITPIEEKTFHECTSNCRREGCPNCEHGYDEEHTCPVCDKEATHKKLEPQYVLDQRAEQS